MAPDAWRNRRKLYGGPTERVSILKFVPSRRFDDHIRDLCANVAKASDLDLPLVMTELKAALREHTLAVENKAIKDLLQGMGKPDRRHR